jgi:hypothetical protein
MDGAVLAGAVEGKDVIAALNTGARAFAVELFGGAIEAGVHDEERALGV